MRKEKHNLFRWHALWCLGLGCMAVPFGADAAQQVVTDSVATEPVCEVKPSCLPCVDSVMSDLFRKCLKFERSIGFYKANLYIKARTDVTKKNRLLDVVPGVQRFKRGKHSYIAESVNELSFTYPKFYDRRVKAVTSTMPKERGEADAVLDFFQLNLYSTCLFEDKILSPIHPKNRRCYRYALSPSSTSSTYVVTFEPRLNNTQLVSGEMQVNAGTGLVETIRMNGQYGVMKFHISMKMGTGSRWEHLLPVYQELQLEIAFMKNKVKANYQACLDYTVVQPIYSPLFDTQKVKTLDLTNYFSLRNSHSGFAVDSMLMAKSRSLPLSADEQHLYHQAWMSRWCPSTDTTKARSRGTVFWGELGERLITDTSLDMQKWGKIKMSPWLNPVALGYSPSRGVSYSHKLRYSYLSASDHLLQITPVLGYNFTHKQLLWRVNTSWEYNPKHSSRLEGSLRSGDKVYNSEMLEAIRNIPDSVFDIRRLNLNEFKDFHANISHSSELTNGLTLTIGTSYHRRKAVGHNERLTDSLRVSDKYITLAPVVRLRWTPHQYYVYKGRRKLPYYSPYPTFELEWERGVKGVLGSTGSHERWEADMQQSIRFRSLRSLAYRIGAGVFTDQQETYFVDFSNFSQRNLVVDWKDDIGGVFQLLDNRWFNASKYYLSANITYQTPMFLFTRMFRPAHYMQYERLYANVLCNSKMHPYVELGYGFSTYVLDLGFFSSFVNGKYERSGVKFTFELFQ